MKNGMICVLIVRWRMTDTVKYKTVSLRNNIYAKLETMSELLVEGVKLSIPQTIELLLKQEENSQELKSGWGK